MRISTPILRHCLLLGGLPGLLAGTSACQSDASKTAQLRLKRIDDTLLAGNEELRHENDWTIKAIQAQIEKNRQPAAELRVLHQAEALRDSTRQLVSYLHQLRGRLVHQTGNELYFRQLAGHREVAALLGSSATADTLQRQLRTYAGYLRQIAPAADALVPSVPAPDFTGASVAGALATLAQQETLLLLREAGALATLQQRIEKNVSKKSYRALASAEDNEVMPGATYRASFGLAAALYRPTGFAMTANGAPVAIGPDGFGQVAFAVPPLGGAARRQASWVGSITVRTNGRESTFRVRVPYTIVRRR